LIHIVIDKPRSQFGSGLANSQARCRAPRDIGSGGHFH